VGTRRLDDGEPAPAVPRATAEPFAAGVRTAETCVCSALRVVVAAAFVVGDEEPPPPHATSRRPRKKHPRRITAPPVTDSPAISTLAIFTTISFE